VVNVKRFDEDLNTMCRRASFDDPHEIRQQLDSIRVDLVYLYKKNLVKINHSVIELLCARKLLVEGYDVKVEHPLGQDLVCDVYGHKGEGNAIVEIETGFVPPAHALDPASYCYARILSKTARYSFFASRFILGTTVSNILPVPQIFLKPPRYRELEEIKKAKIACDQYYDSPPITLEQLTYARLHSIFILDVDRGRITETSADEYLGLTRDIQNKVG